MSFSATTAASSLRTEPLTLLGSYLHKVAQETLYPQLKLYRFGQRVPLPGNRGTTVNIPYYLQQDPIEAMALSNKEVSGPVSSFAVSAHRYTGTVAGYHGHFRFSDFFWATHEVPGVMAAGVRQLAGHMAKTYDDVIQGKLCAAGQAIHGEWGHASAASTTIATDALSLHGIFAAEESMEAKDAFAFEDGFWPAIFRPRQIYHLFTNAAAIPATGTTLQQWLQTGRGQQKFEMAEVGTIGRLKIMTSTYSVKEYNGTTAGTIGASSYANNSVYAGLVIAPGAFAVIDLEGAPPSIIIQPFGSGGATGDPTKKVMSVGMKAYFTAIAMDTTNRLVRVLTGV